MPIKRIIPCLDVKGGRVVKGVKFVNLKDAGDPVEIAKYYNNQGADEIVFLDITASYEKRATMIDVVKETAKQISVSLTVGGGIRNEDDFFNILNAGADKVAINSAALKDKDLISRSALRFGSKCVVIGIDAKLNENGSYTVYIDGGRTDTNIDALVWAKQAEQLGAGEILLTSMDSDGTKNGFDIELTDLISRNVKIPVIASGGCGKKEDFLEVFQKTNAQSALAASLFHFRELTIPEVKAYLKEQGICIAK